MPELLLELFSEEIPARMQQRAAADLERLVNERLLGAGFLPENVKAFATPRRLALTATGLPLRQPDRREEKKGPRVGAPQAAIDGFLKSAGLSSLDKCETRDDKKGAFYVALVEEKGRETKDVIAGFMPQIVAAFPWPKSMRWGDGDLRWVRPLKRVLCCFDGEIVPFSIDAIAAGDATEGHRVMAPDVIRARNFEAYAAALKRAKVILSAQERAEIIAGEAKTLCEAQGLELVEDKGLLAEVAGLCEWPAPMMGSFDAKFLALPDEVLSASMRGHQKYFSVRNPKTGRLANRFVFVANIEAPDGGAAMRVGYERVLTARLSDAWYLYRKDLAVSLAERAKKLDRVTFFEGLGTMGDKARRIAALAREIAPLAVADPQLTEQAAGLAKADLVAGMVYEFPELQGVMGRYYALEEGAPAVVADAIRDHYRPQGQGDAVPTAPVSVAVALADKIDTLTAFWSIGRKPTGSSDPFALRRAALGVIRTVLDRGVRFSITKWSRIVFIEIVFGPFKKFSDYRLLGRQISPEDQEHSIEYTLTSVFDLPYSVLIGYDGFLEKHREQLSEALSGFPSLLPDDKAEVQKALNALNELQGRLAILNRLEDPEPFANEPISRFSVYARTEQVPDELSRPYAIFFSDFLAFFHDRLKVYLRDEGHRHDQIDAVLMRADGSAEDDLVLIVEKLKALEAFLKTEDGANLAAAYKRAANILKAEEKKDGAAISAAVDAERLQQAEEKALFAALKDAEAKAKAAVAAEKFAGAMGALASLRAPLDAFFDKVTVNAEDAPLRRNRLALLARLRGATALVADFSRLEG